MQCPSPPVLPHYIPPYGCTYAYVHCTHHSVMKGVKGPECQLPLSDLTYCLPPPHAPLPPPPPSGTKTGEHTLASLRNLDLAEGVCPCRIWPLLKRLTLHWAASCLPARCLSSFRRWLRAMLTSTPPAPPPTTHICMQTHTLQSLEIWPMLVACSQTLKGIMVVTFDDHNVIDVQTNSTTRLTVFSRYMVINTC